MPSCPKCGGELTVSSETEYKPRSYDEIEETTKTTTHCSNCGYFDSDESTTTKLWTTGTPAG